MEQAEASGGITISTDPRRLDLDLIHGFLTESYWAKGIPRAVVERSIQHSLCFGAYDGDRQVGFARIVTDRATVAYLGDVFVLPEARKRGVSKLLMEAIVAHADLQGLRRWVLLTRDAHSLYQKYGFTAVANPDRYMERWDPEVYTRKGD
jgi:N-acetylglutamate synthase-like GNAT family acetyltransferase